MTAFDIIKVLNTVQLKLTKWLWLRPLHMAFRKVETVTLPDEERTEVIIYTARYTGKVAQCTPFGTIIVDELAFVSPQYLTRVVTHELAHKRQWYGYLAYPLVIVFGLLAAFLLLGMIGLLVLSLFHPQLLIQVLHLLVLICLVVFVPSSYSWFVEYKAEANTFKKLGVDTVLAIDKKFAPRQKAPLPWRIVGFMTHPPQKLMVMVYRRFNKPQKSN